MVATTLSPRKASKDAQPFEVGLYVIIQNVVVLTVSKNEEVAQVYGGGTEQLFE